MKAAIKSLRNKQTRRAIKEGELKKMKEATLSYRGGWRSVSAIKGIPNSKKSNKFNNTIKMCARTLHDLYRSENKAMKRAQKQDLKRVHK